MRTTIILLTIASITGCTVSTPTAEPPPAAASSSSAPAAPAPETEGTLDESTETFVIDVRSQSEWDSGHVDQAVHIPHTEIAERIAEVTTDKDAKIVVYCAVGGRAGKAKTELEKLGYTNVENGGGYDDVKDRF